jgi:ATP-binding cassette subfamily B protein
VLRLVEPLTVAVDCAAEEPAQPAPAATAVDIQLETVTVTTSSHHALLEDISLSIAPGEHVAIVGASGAGKSSLVGLLLGWHRASRGRILVDGLPLTPERLTDLRSRTAWVDPAAQLWNRSVIDNVRYGCMSEVGPELAEVLDAAELATMLEQQEAGVHTALGEGGTLVSGGEGQRIRFARALYRRDASLVILDEPFRGLDHARRKRLLGLAREHWGRATLLCVTHNVAETLQFDRVLVVDHARIVESGTPKELAAHGEWYRALLSRESEIEEALWNGDGWRRVRLAGGQLEP